VSAESDALEKLIEARIVFLDQHRSRENGRWNDWVDAEQTGLRWVLDGIRSLGPARRGLKEADE